MYATGMHPVLRTDFLDLDHFTSYRHYADTKYSEIQWYVLLLQGISATMLMHAPLMDIQNILGQFLMKQR